MHGKINRGSPSASSALLSMNFCPDESIRLSWHLLLIVAVFLSSPFRLNVRANVVKTFQTPFGISVWGMDTVAATRFISHEIPFSNVSIGAQA